MHFQFDILLLKGAHYHTFKNTLFNFFYKAYHTKREDNMRQNQNENIFNSLTFSGAGII